MIGCVNKVKYFVSVHRSILSSAYGKAMDIFFTEVSGKEKDQAVTTTCLLACGDELALQELLQPQLGFLGDEMRTCPCSPVCPMG